MDELTLSAINLIQFWGTGWIRHNLAQLVKWEKGSIQTVPFVFPELIQYIQYSEYKGYLLTALFEEQLKLHRVC